MTDVLYPWVSEAHILFQLLGMWVHAIPLVTLWTMRRSVWGHTAKGTATGEWA